MYLVILYIFYTYGKNVGIDSWICVVALWYCESDSVPLLPMGCK